MTVKRMDNVGIVVDDIDGDIEFFTELGRHVSAVLHPRSRRNSHRARPAARAADFPG